MYKVRSISEPINIDGLDKEACWSSTKLLKDFTFPWNEIPSPKTTFKAVHDDDFIYFFYYADDDDLILKRSGDDEMDAVASDRVEIFIRNEDETQPYYSFEMDPLGRVFDSKGEFGKYIDKEYDFPKEDLIFKGSIKDDHYTLEGKIRISKLEDLDLVSNDRSIMMGLYRGEYFIGDDNKEKTYWMSWVIPDSDTPNFHIPSSFGKLKLQ